MIQFNTISRKLWPLYEFGTWGPYSRCNHSNLSHARNHSNPSLTHHSNHSLTHHSNHSLTHHSNHLHLPQKYKVPFARFARFRGLIKECRTTCAVHLKFPPKKRKKILAITPKRPNSLVNSPSNCLFIIPRHIVWHQFHSNALKSHSCWNCVNENS